MELKRMPHLPRTRRHISYRNSSYKQTVHCPLSIRKSEQLPGLPCGDKVNLYVTGISITKLGGPTIANSGRNELLTVRYDHNSHVTSAQTSGWRLKCIPVNNAPAIHSYRRPIKVNLNGHPLNCSNAHTEEFVQRYGKVLPPAVSQSWYNYQFASYTVLSRNSAQPEDTNYRTEGHGSTGARHFHCVQKKEISSSYKQTSKYQSKNNMKPLYADAATQTSKPHTLHVQENESSNLVNKNTDSLDLKEVSTNLQAQKELLVRKHTNSQNHSMNLLLPDPQLDLDLSHFLKSRERNTSRPLSPSPIVVRSPEPWTSQTPPDETQLSITVPSLPRPTQQ